MVLSPTWEWLLATLYVALLAAAEFSDVAAFELFLEFGLAIGLLPLIGILGGRYWPYLFVLPMVALPIAGKTLVELCYKHHERSLVWGWTLLLILPLLLTTIAAIWLARQGKAGQTSRGFARWGLLLTTWLYFALNWYFFRLPWPWQEWTGRTPSGIIFLACAAGLTAAALTVGIRTPQHQDAAITNGSHSPDEAN